MKFNFLLLFLTIISTSSFAQNKTNSIQIKSTKELKDFFKYSTDRMPMICGHRGGAQTIYPENSIANLEYTLSKVPAFFEIDPRMTKDSVIVVLHDATLDRTTTGTGKLADYTWKEIQSLRLKDKNGNVTNEKIHQLDEILQWAKGKTLLMLDKKDVPFHKLYEAIKRNEAEHYVIISAYEPEEALFYYKKNPNLMFEIFVKNEERLKAYEATGIPSSNMIAYFGQPKNKEFYDLVHNKGMMVMIFTAKFMEKEKDKATRIESYKKSIRQGGDILLSDRAIEAYRAIEEFIPSKSSKEKYFSSTDQ